MRQIYELFLSQIYLKTFWIRKTYLLVKFAAAGLVLTSVANKNERLHLIVPQNLNLTQKQKCKAVDKFKPPKF